jgi:hypothetical protein
MLNSDGIANDENAAAISDLSYLLQFVMRKRTNRKRNKVIGDSDFEEYGNLL